MADTARRIFLRLLHLMNRADSVGKCRFTPSEASIARFPYRSDGVSVKMAGAAHHAGMSVMGCFFVMGLVTRSAISNRLVAVAEFHASWMADPAGNFRMWS